MDTSRPCQFPEAPLFGGSRELDKDDRRKLQIVRAQFLTQIERVLSVNACTSSQMPSLRRLAIAS